MTKTPTLYRLAADRQYSRIPARVEANPDDLLWTDRYGSTALHLLCQAGNIDHALLAAVAAILQRAPDQVAWSNIATWTPLHFAVEKRLSWGGGSPTTALILNLIKACPMAVSVRTRMGYKTKTPFHIACEADAEYEVLEAMLAVNPALATEPYTPRDMYFTITENPLQLLWKTNKLKENNSSSSSCSTEEVERKMALLLRAAHCGTVVETEQPARSFRVLNAACSVRTPRDYFCHIFRKHREEVSVPDEDGLYALHYAVGTTAQSEPQAYTQFVLQMLLEVFPKAASCPDKDGCSPLHVAIRNPLLTWHKGGVRELTYADTSVLYREDPVTGLPPFLASAENAVKSKFHLSTTYELLRAEPAVLSGWRCER